MEEKYRAFCAGTWPLKPLAPIVRNYRRLAKRGIETIPDVLAKYDTLHRRTQRVVLDLVGYTSDRRVVPLLIRVFRDDPGLRSDTINPLSWLGGKRAYKFTRSLIEGELAAASPNLTLLEPASWTLARMFCEGDAERDAAYDLLLDVFAWDGVSASLRATVLDNVAMNLSDTDRRTSIYRRARRVVLEALSDPEDEVRFFAIYAVGLMDLTEALPRLRRMVRTDKGACPGLWTVAEEAQDVISHLTTGWWPDREPQTCRVEP